MSAIRVRIVGNNPCTKIYCDWTNGLGGGCPSNTTPPTDWDAREARRVAKAHGWVRVEGKDYCPQHVCEHGYVPGDHHYEGGCGLDARPEWMSHGGAEL